MALSTRARFGGLGPEGSGGSDFGSGSGELGEQGERGGGTGSLAPQESSPAPTDSPGA